MNKPVTTRSPMNMREAMPETAAFVDAMRTTFGEVCVNESIRNGMNGFPTFHACENGHEVGTKAAALGCELKIADMVLIKPEEDHDAKRRK